MVCVASNRNRGRDAKRRAVTDVVDACLVLWVWCAIKVSARPKKGVWPTGGHKKRADERAAQGDKGEHIKKAGQARP